MSKPGLTKSEHWALTALAALILVGVLVRFLPQDRDSADIWIETGPGWETISPNAVPSEARGGTGILGSSSPAASSPGPGSASGKPPAQANAWTGKIDINTADARALEGLPGIGKVKAQAIADFRRSSGPFRNVEELENVPGIGPKTLQNLRPFVSASGFPSPPAKSAQSDPVDQAPRIEKGDGAPPLDGNRTASPSGRVDINRAGYDELQEIPGIGPVLAGRIIESRQKRAFLNPSDLIRIKGIGPTSFSSMEPYVEARPTR